MDLNRRTCHSIFNSQIDATILSLLVHYDQKKELIHSCDASPYGLGAHKFPDQSEKPIAFASRTLAFASRTLAPSERNYSQLEKEGLAIIFAVKKFDKYLAGHHFTLYSDHQPLQFLFNEGRQVPIMAASRIQRWSLTLGAYDYNIKYRPGSKMSNADALSRLPLPDQPPDSQIAILGDIAQVLDHVSTNIVTAKDIKRWTEKDPVLLRVQRCILHGWPLTSSDTII